MDSDRRRTAKPEARQIADQAEGEPAREHIRNVLTMLQDPWAISGHPETPAYFGLDRDTHAAVIRRLTLALRQLEKPVVLLTRDLAGYMADVAAGVEPSGENVSAVLDVDDQIRMDVAAVCGLLQSAKAGHITPTEAIDAALLRFLPEGAL